MPANTAAGKSGLPHTGYNARAMRRATAEAPSPRASEPRKPIAPAIVALVVFVVALAVRVDIPFEDHTEGDELLYAALVQQLEDG